MWEKIKIVQNVGCLCSSVVRAIDRQSKDLGSYPSAVESVFFSTERFQILKFYSNLNLICFYSTNLFKKNNISKNNMAPADNFALVYPIHYI